MEMTAGWPTMIGKGKFEVDGLIEHIFSSYDLDNPPSIEIMCEKCAYLKGGKDYF